MSAREPGWYPDASVPGHERWWNGGEWSHVTRPAPGGPPPRARAAGPGTPYGPWAGGTGAGWAGGGTGYVRTGTRREVTTPDGLPLAHPGLRLLARIVDGLLVSVVAVALRFGDARTISDAMTSMISRISSTPPGQALPSAADLSTPALTAAMTALTIAQLVVSGLYHTGFVALRGATPGKMLVGVRVRAWETDGLPGWRRAAIRWAVTDLPSLVPLVSFVWTLLDRLWLLGDARRQCLHDKPAGTVVVRGRPIGGRDAGFDGSYGGGLNR